MLAIIASVPGKLKTLLDRLTSTRAANLDKLDANITTRAAASTALSNAVWTDARAANLDLVTAVDLPPIASGIVDGASYHAAPSAVTIPANLSNFATSSTASASYVNAVNISGSGYITGLFHYLTSNAASGTQDMELIIDGVTVATRSGTNTTPTSGIKKVAQIVGHVSSFYNGTDLILALHPGAPVFFKTSLQIRHKTSGGANSAVYYSYVKTS